MRMSLRRAVTWAAIYVVALQAGFLGVAPVTTNSLARIDPFSIVCHSVVDAAGDEVPTAPNLIPGHACDHCMLCSAAALPPAPDLALNVDLESVRITHVLRPISATARTSVTPKLARGPPQIA